MPDASDVAPSPPYDDGHGDARDRGLLRPRQDDHRQVEHVGLQQALPSGRPDHAPRGAASAYAQFVFLVGGADHDQMEKMRQFMSQLVAGWDVATVREIVADTLHNIVDPLVYDEAVSLIEEHQLAGRDVVIVSASGAEVVEPIGEMLGADRVIATRLEIVDGRYTGEIDFYAYAEEKARAIEDLAERAATTWTRCYAYSDSITDVHMLEVVGHPHAVNPDKELRKVAGRRAGRSSSSPSRSPCAPGCRCPRAAHAGCPCGRRGRRRRWGPLGAMRRRRSLGRLTVRRTRHAATPGAKSTLVGAWERRTNGEHNKRTST